MQFNKRLLCCFRLTTSHTVGSEVKKEQTHQRQETLSTLSFFLVSNLRSIQSQGSHMCRHLSPAPQSGRCGSKLKVKGETARWSAGGRCLAHLHTCIMEKLPTAEALWLFPVLPICKDSFFHFARHVYHQLFLYASSKDLRKNFIYHLLWPRSDRGVV